MTIADFHSFGSEPVLNINENKVERGPQSTPFSVFKSIGGIFSGPAKVFTFCVCVQCFYKWDFLVTCQTCFVSKLRFKPKATTILHFIT